MHFAMFVEKYIRWARLSDKCKSHNTRAKLLCAFCHIAAFAALLWLSHLSETSQPL